MNKIIRNILLSTLFLTISQSINAEDSPLETIRLMPLEVIGVLEDEERIFSNILRSELSTNFSFNQVESKKILSGSISKLGEKIIVVVIVKEANEESKIYFKEKVSVNNISELDIVAERIAQAIIKNKQFKDTITISNVTNEEVIPKPLKKSTQGFVFEMAAFEPLGGNNYGMGETGSAIYSGAVIEYPDYFIQAGLGYRRGSDDSYREIPFDISMGKFFSDAGMSPFLSGGLGWRYLEEGVDVKSSSGGAIQKTVNYTFKNYDSGFGGHAKIGFVLMRENATRAVISLRYDISDLKFLDRDRAQAIGLQLGLMTF